MKTADGKAKVDFTIDAAANHGSNIAGVMMMRWSNRPKVERPEYPKMVPIASPAEAQERLALLLGDDPEAEIVDGGGRGVYIRVHNHAAEVTAKLNGETRSFPLA